MPAQPIIQPIQPVQPAAGQAAKPSVLSQRPLQPAVRPPAPVQASAASRHNTNPALQPELNIKELVAQMAARLSPQAKMAALNLTRMLCTLDYLTEFGHGLIRKYGSE